MTPEKPPLEKSNTPLHQATREQLLKIVRRTIADINKQVGQEDLSDDQLRIAVADLRATHNKLNLKK